MSEFPKRETSTEKRAKSVEEAISTALTELGINKEEAVIDIIQEPSKGFLGLGSKEAVVKVSVKAAAQAQEPETKPQSVPVKQEAEIVSAAESGRIYTSESPAENAKNFLCDVLSAMGIDVNVQAELDGDVVKINLDGENMGIVIGKRGDTLDSLQYLTSLVVNRNSEDYIKISIDTENYREKRSEALEALAERLAAKVARTGRKFALEPMNPYERRIIHSKLQESEEVTTFSVGQEPYRKVVIAPKNPKHYGNRRGYNKNGRRQQQSSKGGYSRSSYNADKKSAQEKTESGAATYKADFKPQQHKAEYKNFEEYLAAHSK